MGSFDAGTVAAILGGMGAGGVLLEVVRQWFTRSGRQFDEASQIRKELRERVRDLEERLDREHLDREQERRQSAERMTRIEQEREGLRYQVAKLTAKLSETQERLRDIEQRCLAEHGVFRREIADIQPPAQADEEHPA